MIVALLPEMSRTTHLLHYWNANRTEMLGASSKIGKLSGNRIRGANLARMGRNRS